MKSIRDKILFGCLTLTALAGLIGLYAQYQERKLAGLALRIYDEAFMGVSYLRSAQVGFAGLVTGAHGGALPPDGVNEVLSDLKVAQDRAMSSAGRGAAEHLAQSIADLTKPHAATIARPSAAQVQAEFEDAVETFAGDGFRYRRDVNALVTAAVNESNAVIAITLASALAVTLLLTRLIAPPVRRAVGIAKAIAGGKLDNDITVTGDGETGDLLRALSTMQTSISDSLARINALMAAQAESHAGELASHHARMEAALENMNQGLCLFGADGRLAVVNRRFAEMFCRPPLGATAETVMRQAGLEMLLENESAPVLTCELRDGRSIAVSRKTVAGGGWVATYEDVTERRATEARFAHMARHDALTGLANRLMLHEHMQHVLARARRGSGAAVLCLDLDRFKAVNDTLGHAAGDMLLRAVTQRLRDCTRETDLVVRLGGDEFAIVQDQATQPFDATSLAARLVDVLSQPFDINNQEVVVGASIGIAMADEGLMTADALLKCADLALYKAKADGRGTFRFFEPEMDVAIQERRQLEQHLRHALASGQLVVYYQPLVQPGGIAGFEALLRWNHPERGFVSPAIFVPVAEEIGLIAQIGAWVMRQACHDAASWPGQLKVAVNLSPAQFRNRRLAEDAAEALAASGLSPKRLELEITESLLLQDDDAVIRTLHALRRQGIRIAMDDFGTGYSSLSYLRRFPFDKIKIDQSFVKGMEDDEDCRKIIRAVIGLGKSLRIAVNAEGVETEEQLNTLRAEGCGEIQGYYFSRPIPVDGIPALLSRFGNATETGRAALAAG